MGNKNMSSVQSYNNPDAKNGSSENDESFRKVFNLKAFGHDLLDNSTQSPTGGKTSKLSSTDWHNIVESVEHWKSETNPKNILKDKYNKELFKKHGRTIHYRRKNYRVEHTAAGPALFRLIGTKKRNELH